MVYHEFLKKQNNSTQMSSGGDGHIQHTNQKVALK